MHTVKKLCAESGFFFFLTARNYLLTPFPTACALPRGVAAYAPEGLVLSSARHFALGRVCLLDLADGGISVAAVGHPCSPADVQVEQVLSPVGSIGRAWAGGPGRGQGEEVCSYTDTRWPLATKPALPSFPSRAAAGSSSSSPAGWPRGLRSTVTSCCRLLREQLLLSR